jgi:ABC-type phosphate/phosphonate transport system permease subunit
MSQGSVALASYPTQKMRKKLVWYSILGGLLITLLGIGLRFAGINWPVIYLTYPGSYFMQAFFQRFLEWIPWRYADNPITEILSFCVFNVLGYAFVIFLMLRVFFPDRSHHLPRLGSPN